MKALLIFILLQLLKCTGREGLSRLTVFQFFFVVVIWDKVYKNGPNKFGERQPLKGVKGYGLL